MIPVADVTTAVISYFHTHDKLSSTPSPTGNQLHNARIGLTGSGSRKNTTHCRYVRLADLGRVMRDLTAKQLEALRLKYWQTGTPRYLTRRNTNGVLVGYTKACRKTDRECGAELDMSEHRFKRLLRAARAKVGQNLIAIAEKEAA